MKKSVGRKMEMRPLRCDNSYINRNDTETENY